MKRVVFKLTLVGSDGTRRQGEVTLVDHIAVEARSLNSAWPKAAARALRVARQGETLHALEWESINEPIQRQPMPPAVA